MEYWSKSPLSLIRIAGGYIYPPSSAHGLLALGSGASAGLNLVELSEGHLRARQKTARDLLATGAGENRANQRRQGVPHGKLCYVEAASAL